jgi:hypothetical protein
VTGRRGRRLAGLVLAVALTPTFMGAVANAAGTAGDGRPSLARLADTATPTWSIQTDTLDPPTSLSAVGGAFAALSWTATVDTYATGYNVLRGTASGGPYSAIGTVTPRTTVSTNDTPAASGTYYYVLQSYFQSWTSANSNQASAVVTLGSTATGFKTCTAASNAADTGGDGNGYETTPANGCIVDGSLATDASSGTNTTISCTDAGKDRHRYWDFGLGVPASVLTVSGIQVRASVGENNTTGTTQLCAQLSWNAGVSWTTAKSVSLTATAITAYTLGATNDTWGRSWLGAEFANASFRVRLIDVSNQTTKNFRLDGLSVQVTYTP